MGRDTEDPQLSLATAGLEVQAACWDRLQPAGQAGVDHQHTEPHVLWPGLGLSHGLFCHMGKPLEGEAREEAEEFVLARIGHPLICCY